MSISTVPYISVYMQNQFLSFYQHEQWIQITSKSHQNAYKEVFWLKFQGGGACPQTAQIVCRTETEPPSTMMLSHFSGGNPVL